MSAVARDLRERVRSIGVAAFRGVAIATLGLLVASPDVRAEDPLVDAAPVWWENDRADIEMPAERSPNLLRDMFTTTVVRPVRRHTQPSALARRVGTAFGGQLHREAANPNALDEVPNSSWFTNRIGLFPMAPAVCAGSLGRGPDRSGPWTIIRAKTEGVTPGFNIRDATGAVHVIKFDPEGERGVTAGAGAITGRIFHAAGYNVPEDVVVTFRREDLRVADDVTVRDALGRSRKMTDADLDEIFTRLEPRENGEYVAIASRFLDGVPVGPFDWVGLREDDPNDRIKHQYRRELRGLRVFAAWLNHFDTKQANTLDMWVEDGDRRYVRHYLIDFASTLGAGANGVKPLHSMEYGFDLWETLGRMLAVGFREDRWRRIERPRDLPEVGYWWASGWDPTQFKPLVPNGAFARMTDRDGYWAAKIISAFEDEHLAAICETGRYEDPRATEWIAAVLAARRDIIAEHWFLRVCPVDFFRADDGVLRGTDLGVTRGIWSAKNTRYRARTWSADADRNGNDDVDWQIVDSPRLRIPPDTSADRPFQAFEFQVDRGEGWSPSVIAWVARSSERVVAVDR